MKNYNPKLIILFSIIFFSVLLLPKIPSAFAASPVLYFSDLDSGPKSGWEGSATKGAAVSVWGKNFGATRGSSFVTVNGTQLTSDSDYAEWGVTGHENGVARGMERVTFWLNSDCQDGAGTITLTVNGVTSNSLPFTVRAGNVYFVSMEGNDNNNGIYTTNRGGNNGPWRNIYKADVSSGAFAPGDIVYVRAGTYTEVASYGAHMTFHSGDSGEEGRPIAYIAYPAEKVVIGDGTKIGFRDHSYRVEYVVIAKFYINVAVSAVGTGTSDTVNKSNWRVVGNDMTSTGSGWTGLIAFGASPKLVENYKILGNHIHDLAGDKYYHAMYMGTAYQCYQENNGIEIAWNELHDFSDTGTGDSSGGPSGIYIHPTDSLSGPADNVQIHDNIVYNLTHAGIHIASRVKKVDIWNNIVSNCGRNSNRPGVFFNPNNDTPNVIKFYNNVVYDTDVAGTAMLDFTDGILNLEMRNNIFYSRVRPFGQFHGNVVSDGDIWYGATPPTSAINAVTQNPQFINPSELNFYLEPTSPAINTGSSLVSGIVKRDFVGVLRPQGNGYDIGAYEYDEGQTPAATCSDGIQNQDETGIDCGGVCPACSVSYNLTHFISLLTSWLKNSSEPNFNSSSDLNNDGIVNTRDLGIMMSNWGN